MKKKILLLGLIGLMCLSGCSEQTKINETTEITTTEDYCIPTEPAQVDKPVINDNTLEFSLNLFKQQNIENKDENVLLSPLSIIMATGMLENGASGDTLSNMQNIIGNGNLEDFNTTMQQYVVYSKHISNNTSTNFNIANSFWINDAQNIEVKKEYTDLIIKYYNADVKMQTFDSQCVNDINNWVDTKTNHMIDSIISQLEPSEQVLILNAVLFDGKWTDEYKTVAKYDFYNYDETISKAEMMISTESIYIQDDSVTGFIKPYADNNFAFMAILPDNDIDIDDYIASMDANTFKNLYDTRYYTSVDTYLPKFKIEYFKSLNNTFNELGININPGNYSNISDTDLVVNNILHKTVIEVDEKGTEAAAVTGIAMGTTSIQDDTYLVQLDRPFIYAIIDNYGYPIFIGVMKNLPN